MPQHGPQPPAGAEPKSEAELLLSLVPTATAKAESCCSKRVLLHFGQRVFSELRTRASNFEPQPLHIYSKMGITLFVSC